MRIFTLLTVCLSFCGLIGLANTDIDASVNNAHIFTSTFVDKLESLDLKQESSSNPNIISTDPDFKFSSFVKDLSSQLKKENISETLFLTLYSSIILQNENAKARKLEEKNIALREAELNFHRECKQIFYDLYRAISYTLYK